MAYAPFDQLLDHAEELPVSEALKSLSIDLQELAAVLMAWADTPFGARLLGVIDLARSVISRRQQGLMSPGMKQVVPQLPKDMFNLYQAKPGALSVIGGGGGGGGGAFQVKQRNIKTLCAQVSAPALSDPQDAQDFAAREAVYLLAERLIADKIVHIEEITKHTYAYGLPACEKLFRFTIDVVPP